MANPRSELNILLSSVNVSAPSPTKFLGLDKQLAGVAGLEPQHVVAVTVSKPGNFTVRAVQSTRATAAHLLVGVFLNEADAVTTRDPALDDVRKGTHQGVLFVHRGPDGTWHASWGTASQLLPEETRQRLAAAFGTQWEMVTAPTQGSTTTTTTPVTPRLGLPTVVPTRDLVIDPRIRRMLYTSVASRPAVMLVGPPGTGKSQLVEELLRDIADEPSIVSMTVGHEANIVTPDESWSVRELVGGDTVDDNGRIRFAPGAVLDAITHDRWLVLDEANRADMDRIFGGLLTWLAGQRVTVGRVTSDPDAGPVHLGWTAEPASVVDDLDRLRSTEPGRDPVTFLAGSEWRMLGTYNALDAQRVFRFGSALGRRFAHVPVPAPDPEAFALALEPFMAQVPGDARNDMGSAIVDLYRAHYESGATSMGPAVFLGMPAYVGQGLTVGSSRSEVLAEAYLTSLGTLLARLEDDQLDRLALTVASQDLLGDEWAWVRANLLALR